MQSTPQARPTVPPRPNAPKGPPTPRWIKLLLVCAGTVTVCIAALTLSFAWAVSKATHGVTIDDVEEYPKARQAFVMLHGNDVRHLPEAIPAEATGVELRAYINDFLQAEPGMHLIYRLPSEAAAEELARLRSLDPASEEAEPEVPTRAWEAVGSSRRNGGIELDFTVEVFPMATVWVDPESGWFVYEVADD